MTAIILPKASENFQVAAFFIFLLLAAGCGTVNRDWNQSPLAFETTCQPGAKPPLIKAIEAGNRSRVEKLLKHGANPNVGQPSFGPRPLDVALKLNNPEIISLLKEYGAKTGSEVRDDMKIKN